MSLLGLDIGTTGCKAIIFSEAGTILGRAYREYPLIQPQPGWIELDPALVWSRVEDSIREAVALAGSGDPVVALAASVQGEAVCPVDDAGTPLANSIVTFDNRTLQQAEQLRSSLGSSRIYDISGQPLHPMGTVNKIAWWKQNRPQLYQQAHKFLCFGDFALSQLGVPPVMDMSMAARTMAYDIQQKRWSPDVLGALDLDEGKLPAVSPSGTAVGTLPDETCERLGLPRGVLAVVGGHDQPCGALGAGAVAPGRAMYAIGTVECVTPSLGAFTRKLGERGFPCYPHVVSGQYVTLGFNFGGGSILRWYRDNFAQAEMAEAQASGRDVYDVILDPLDADPGRLMMLPHFAGTGTPWLDPSSKGAFVGLTLATTREDVLKAILEGTTYEIALNVQEMQAAGVSLGELRAIGGGAKSTKWLQIKANILGIPLARLSISEAACLGAALLAGYGAGIFPNLVAIADELAKPVSRVDPDRSRHQVYMERVALYRQIYPALKEILHAI